MSHIRPHSSEWFEKMRSIDAQQAAHTAELVRIAGRVDICTICGDSDSLEFRSAEMPELTLRLCADCRRMQKNMHGLDVEPV